MKELIPTITTRHQKGSALNHLEMDTNLGSLLHTCSFSSEGSHEESYKNAQYVDFSYVPIYEEQLKSESIAQASPIRFKYAESAEDICKKIANETIPGNLTIEGTLRVRDFIYETSSSPVSMIYSDERLKDHVVNIKDGSLDKVLAIDPVKFDWKTEAQQLERGSVGVIAQTVKEVFPEAVLENSNGYLSVDYIKLIPILFGAIQELSDKIKQLEENK